MADRVRAIWHERVIIIATSLPVDLDIDLLVTLDDLMRAAGQAAAARRGVAERGWWLGAGIRRDSDYSLIGDLLGFRLSLAQFRALLPSASGPPVSSLLISPLAPAEAFHRASIVHPGLRAPPPPGGVLRECLRRHGLLVSWSDLSALVPELVPDAVAARAVKDAEGDELRALRASLRTAPYRIAGRRGRSGIVAWDPARVANPAVALTALLGDGVTVDWQPPSVPVFTLPVRRAVAGGRACIRCPEPAEPGHVLCESCAWLAGEATGPRDAAHRQAGGPHLAAPATFGIVTSPRSRAARAGT
jgi:hypothetical protein